MFQEDYSDDEYRDDVDVTEEILPPPSRRPPHGHFPHWKYWLPIVVAIIVGGALIITLIVRPVQSAYSVMPAYLNLDNQQVAQVQVATTKKLQLYSVKIILYDQAHHPTTDNIQCYIQSGDTVTFQGDILTFVPWMSSLGLHPGYKLIGIQGCSSDANYRDTHALPIPNNGEDTFFAQLQGRPWAFSTAEAYYSKPFSLRPAQLHSNLKTETYNIYTSQTGLYALLSK